MFIRQKFKNKQGFTLIEIIASIAILGMVIAIFLPIFPQMMSWTEKTDDELVASNLLGEVAVNIKDDEKNETIVSFAHSAPTCSENSENMQKVPDFGAVDSAYELNDQEYHAELWLCKEKNVDDLYRTNIRIHSTSGENITESYTYISSSPEGDAGE